MTAAEIDVPRDLGPVPRWLAPAVDWVARRQVTVHRKLLFGFMSLAVLLLALGLFSIVVLSRVDRQVETLNLLHTHNDIARDMIYKVTAQSHYRAMAIVTEIDSWDDKIYAAKEGFSDELEVMRTMSVRTRSTNYDRLGSVDDRFADESRTVSELYYAGELTPALDMHIQVEHETSHELEDQLNVIIAEGDELAAEEAKAFQSDRRLLTYAVAAFSAASLGVALLLGAVLSWSLIRPVRRVDRALERIADGDFDQRVDVPNRDEFGSMTFNLNKTTAQLGQLYAELHTLNAGLQETVDSKVAELGRASLLRRYVSPQLAESIMAGETEVELSANRKYLTIFMSDIRGFTEMTENMEPEHLVDELNEYLSEMTEIVFRHGGTLDKYEGDAILVFFGDPVAQADQEHRAVRMAIEMQNRVEELAPRWARAFGASFQAGMGISSGWVTVGNIGSSARSDYTVLGNAVNLASRLADRAEAGQILVSGPTMAKVADTFSAEVIEEVTLKGVSRPIEVYSLHRTDRSVDQPSDE